MADFEWLVKMLTQGGAVSAVVAVVGLILCKYVPTLIKEFKDTVQGIVNTHAETLKEERELFRGEMKELRTSFATGLKELTDSFSKQNDTLSGRIDGLRDEVHDLRAKLEK